MGVLVTPSRVEAAISCDSTTLQNLTLPDPDDPNDPTADGWTKKTKLNGIPPNPKGSVPEIADEDQNAGVARGTAQLFTQQVDADVTCYYLRREKLKPDGMPLGTTNGVLCFDSTDCSVCAWDKNTKLAGNPPDPDPKGTLISDMRKPNSYGEENGMRDCSSCHVSGLTVPMDAMYDQLDATNLLDLMNQCVSKGGPKWKGAPASWAVQDPNSIVPSSEVPESCSEFGACHDAFLKPKASQTNWCDFAGQAFKRGGSMAEDYTKEECTTFMSKLGCDPAKCSSSSAVPAMPYWGVGGLAALMTTSAYLVLRKRSPRSG